MRTAAAFPPHPAFLAPTLPPSLPPSGVGALRRHKLKASVRDLEEAEHAQQRAPASNSSSSRPTPEGSRCATPPSSADATAPDEVAMAVAMGASAAGGDADGAAGWGRRATAGSTRR